MTAIDDFKNKIIQGDCRNFIDKIPKDSFLISDPPYNQGYHYDNYKDNLEEQEYRDLLFQIFSERKSVIIHYPEQTINILSTLDLGKCEDVISWVYPSNTTKQSRLITWWNCKPDMRKIPQAYKNPKDKRIKKRIMEGKNCRGYDWWEINQVKNVSKINNSHSCPIPEEVARRIIISTVPKNGIVVDPFCGSGTILKVSKQLGINYLGFELSKNYIKIAEARIKAISNPLF